MFFSKTRNRKTAPRMHAEDRFWERHEHVKRVDICIIPGPLWSLELLSSWFSCSEIDNLGRHRLSHKDMAAAWQAYSVICFSCHRSSFWHFFGYTSRKLLCKDMSKWRWWWQRMEQVFQLRSFAPNMFSNLRALLALLHCCSAIHRIESSQQSHSLTPQLNAHVWTKKKIPT